MESISAYFPSWPANDDSYPKWRYAVALAASAGLLYGTYSAIGKYHRQQRLWSLVKKKREQRDAEMVQLRKILECDLEQVTGRKRIVQMGFEELRSSLQTGKLTAVETLKAFQWRALEMQEKTNFACQFILEAGQWAEELDSRYKGAVKKPPLFGIPMSVKECIRVAGCDATGGFAQYIGQPVPEDNELVEILKRAGAIPFVTTNVLTTMGSFGCSNLIYGYTTNPHNPNRTSGGSSAGEGAAVASGASALGLGTDIGGSLRTPAHCCGAAALKPTAGRIPRGKPSRVAAGGITAIKVTLGPVGADVDSLVWFMRTVCNWPEYLDPSVVPMPFNESLYSSKQPLTIGYYYNNNWLAPTPACIRAVEVARKVLEQQGHKLVPLQFPFDAQESQLTMELFVAALFPDGGVLPSQWMSRDLMDSDHKAMYHLFSQPIWLRKLKAKFMKSPHWRTLYQACESDTLSLRIKYGRIDELKSRFFQFWRQHELDCVICPAGASPALPVNVAPRLMCIPWSYCALYNLLEYPAGVLKCTNVSEADEKEALESSPPKNADNVTRLLKECQRGTRGLPIGVQVVALPFQEEMCLRVMKEIESGLPEPSMKG